MAKNYKKLLLVTVGLAAVAEFEKLMFGTNV